MALKSGRVSAFSSHMSVSSVLAGHPDPIPHAKATAAVEAERRIVAIAEQVVSAASPGPRTR